MALLVFFVHPCAVCCLDMLSWIDMENEEKISRDEE